MKRQALAIVVVLCLYPATLFAQATRLTVDTTSADVRMGPSVANPVIGHAPRGTVLEITRDVGDWYKVTWPDAKDGVGYVRRSEMSSLRGVTPGGIQPGRSALGSSFDEKSAVLADLNADRQPAARQPLAARPEPASPVSHVIGMGALIGGPMGVAPGFGLTGRAWPNTRLGVQVAVARQTLTSTVAPGRMTSTQIAPSVLLTLPGRLTDYVWFRPYLGAGGHLNRSTLSGVVTGLTTTARAYGLQAFGGGELTMAGAPRFAVSADAGYHWVRTTFDGFEPGGIGVSASGHWYFK